MSENSDELSRQMAGFQKIWMESFSRIVQSAFTFKPDAAPPELLQQMRSGILEALSRSWNEYLRSPQFLEGMKQWTDNAIFFRKMTNDFMTRARHETQDIAREDIDTIMLAVRHMETRILDRMEKVEERLEALDGRQINGSAGFRPKPDASAKTSAQSGRAQSRKSRGAKQPKAAL